MSLTNLHADSQFTVAGIGIRVGSTEDVVYPDAYERFCASGGASEIQINVSSKPRLPDVNARVIYQGRSHWRAKARDGAFIYEMFYPPSNDVFCHMRATGDGLRISVVFDRQNLGVLRRIPSDLHYGPLFLPFPFDQLSVIPALAKRDGFLVHACGAIVHGRALVFAGHSGDGKTTLSHLLAGEGLELLSDERIAIRFENGRFMAYGTPWHGEGGVVSAASYPLGGVFILRKASEHRILRGAPSALAAELLSRSIVPYYLPEETSLILGLVQQVCESVPLRDLEFRRAAGLTELLAAFDPAA